MKPFIRLLSLGILATSLLSCPGIIESRDGKFVSLVQNIELINSKYDDFNSNMPFNYGSYGVITFSSGRATEGKYLQLHSTSLYLNYTEQVGQPRFTFTDRGPQGVMYSDILDHRFVYDYAERTNGPWNVYGPMAISPSYLRLNSSVRSQMLFMADDSAKNLNIKCVYKNLKGDIVKRDVAYLNSQADDAYPFVHPTGNNILFCSNRGGNFDLYEAQNQLTSGWTPTPQPGVADSLVNAKRVAISKVAYVNSAYEDKCPYIWQEKVLIFVSNRPGGFGGFDIWYALKQADGTWGQPVNAGSRINTAANEYRPIAPFGMYYNYPLMIFSSDRPGGLGGYDLYLTGLLEPEKIKW